MDNILNLLKDYSVIVISIITIIGWLISHYLYLKAQKKASLNTIKNEARVHIVSSLKEYLNWLEEVFLNYTNLHFFNETGTNIDKLNLLIDEFYFTVNRISGKIYPVDILEQYNILFPNIADVRIYLWTKHVELHSHLRFIASKIKYLNNEFVDEGISVLINKIDGYKLGAQQWVVKDLILCIQNITLAEITGTKLIKFPEDNFGNLKNIKIKHPRIKYDSKGNYYIDLQSK